LKIRIGEEFYDLDSAVAHPTLNNVKYLARASRGTGIPAVTPKTMQNLFIELGEQSQTPEFDATEFFSDPDRLANLQGVVFLARRAVGEDVTFEDSGDFDMTDFSFEDDEPVDEVEAPKDESGDAPL